MSNAAWIWYPDDFEIELSNKFMAERYERDVFIPPFWKQFSCYQNVKFYKTVELAKGETIQVRVEGLYNVQLDGNYIYESYGSVYVPEGRHEIVVTVYNAHGLPTLKVEGESIISDSTWKVSCNDHNFVDAACDEEFLRSYTPNTLRLPSVTVSPVRVMELEGRTVYDFGKEMFGRIYLKGVTSLSTAYYGESLEEVVDIEHCELISRDFREEEKGCFMAGIAKAFRYVTVDGEFAEIEALSENLTTKSKSSFTCGIPRLNEIYAVSEYTLALNSREFLLDGIKRDRWIWCADAYQSCWMQYYSFFDKGVIKRTMTALFGKSPFQVYVNHIMDYTFMWILCFGEYLTYTNDEKYAADNMYKVFEVMEYCLGRRDENGLMDSRPGDWVFVDWADLDNSGEVCFEQILLVAALRECVRLAKRFGYEKEAARYAELLKDTEWRLESFWDEEKHAYIYSFKEGKSDGKVLRHPNIFAVLFDICDDKRKQEIKEYVLKNDEVPAITTPYMRFFELSALCRIGETEYVLEEIKRYWGGMLDEGATSFWEAYDEREKGPEKYAMYGRRYGKSLCHAWGASPLYLIGRYFVGLSPAEDGSSFLLEPKLAGLGDVNSVMPLSKGEVRVEKKGNRLRACSSELCGKLIVEGKEYALLPREEIEVILHDI